MKDPSVLTFSPTGEAPFSTVVMHALDTSDPLRGGAAAVVSLTRAGAQAIHAEAISGLETATWVLGGLGALGALFTLYGRSKGLRDGIQRYHRRSRLGLRNQRTLLTLGSQGVAILGSMSAMTMNIPVLAAIPPLRIAARVGLAGTGVVLASRGFTQCTSASRALKNLDRVSPKHEGAAAPSTLLRQISLFRSWIEDAHSRASLGLRNGSVTPSQDISRAFTEETADLLKDRFGSAAANRLLLLGNAFAPHQEDSTQRDPLQGLKQLTAILESLQEQGRTADGGAPLLQALASFVDLIRGDLKIQARQGLSIFWVGLLLAVSQILALIAECTPATAPAMNLLVASCLLGVAVMSLLTNLDYRQLNLRAERKKNEEPMAKLADLLREAQRSLLHSKTLHRSGRRRRSTRSSAQPEPLPSTRQCPTPALGYVRPCAAVHSAV